VTVVRLGKGQQVGFQRRPGSAGAVAVAGKRLLPLAAGQYEWQVEPERGRIDTRKTAWQTAVIGGAGIALLGFVAYVAIQLGVEQGLSDLNW
jgi:hypothetical protein